MQIMHAYELSTATLRNVLAHPSLQRDYIDDTMDSLANATADAKEVDDAVREDAELASPTDIDESDLEAELQALIKEEEQANANRRQGQERNQEGERLEHATSAATNDAFSSSLPSAPNHSPATPKTPAPVPSRA
jgi:charged multivesicular body protein 7